MKSGFDIKPEALSSFFQLPSVTSVTESVAELSSIDYNLINIIRGTVVMAVQLIKRLLTVKEYHLMGKAGIFPQGDRVELIEGELVQMAAIGTRHAGCVNRLNRLSAEIPETRAIIAIQNPVQLTDRTEPQPDVVFLQPRADYYSTAHPTASEVLLLIEVSDSTVDYDRDVKVPIYARSQIAEVWLVDLEAQCLEVYRQPTPNGYSLIQKFWRGQQVSPLAFPDWEVNIDFILG